MRKYILSFIIFLSPILLNAQELNNEFKFDIYPNPASEFIVLESNTKNIQDFNFQIHSIIGNKINVSSNIISNNKIKFSVKEISNGYYFIIVANDKSKYKKALKFLKK
tara:strand:+ start:497 stop:820 length:324 start_codon:yes stop_codon:yes gene_type:complete